MKTRCLMIQGTGSSVGKSRIVTGLGRILKQDGFNVAPFKSQNMALNSYITTQGLEMGRAQVAQAEACGQEPSVLMNPVLLKPCSDKNSQVIIMGRPHGNLSAMDYHDYKSKLLDIIREAYDDLAKDKDIIVIEGAGSPAEINLRDKDIVNMGMAELVDAPVILVGDIDRGGVFASLAGTMLLLSEEERARVKGVIINKFRGDIELLKPGLKMLEDIIKVPVLGVIPYSNIYIDEEDSPSTEALRLRQKKDSVSINNINIKILSLPRITNFTDFAPLGEYPGVDITYIKEGKMIGEADLVIIPGSENPKESMEIIRQCGWDEEINVLLKKGSIVFGIGSGYFLLGNSITYSIHKSETDQVKGLGLLDFSTRIDEEKIPVRVFGRVRENLPGPANVLRKTAVEGYEIYGGSTTIGEKMEELIRVEKYFDKEVSVLEGLVSSAGNVIGTSIHGIFENPDFSSRFINGLKAFKCGGSLGKDESQSTFDFKAFREEQYDLWADTVRESIDMKKVYDILGVEK